MGLIECEKITWLRPKYLKFLISVVMRSVNMNASVSLTSDWECLGKWTTPYECLLPLPLPSTQEWWEKHNGWEHYSNLHPWPTRDLQTVQVPGSERQLQSRPPSSFPPLENKQRKSTLLTNALRYSLNVYCWSWDSLNPTILRTTRLRKVWRWRASTLPGGLIHIRGRLCLWVSFFFSDSPLHCWYSLFPAFPPTSCQHLLPCTPVQYGNLVSESHVFAFAEVGRRESPVSKAQTLKQRQRLVVTADMTY